MKSIIRCLGCSELIRLSNSYQVAMTEATTSILTGVKTQSDIQGHLCGECNSRAGYHTRKELLNENNSN